MAKGTDPIDAQLKIGTGVPDTPNGWNLDSNERSLTCRDMERAPKKQLVERCIN